MPKYPYNPAKAKALLQQAGLTLPVEVEFWYPTDVSRPYMPDPKRNFQAFAASLEKSGFKVIAARALRGGPTTSAGVQAGTAGALNLLGWTGDFGDPDNFLGTFFRHEQAQFGLQQPEALRRCSTRRARETNLDEARRALPGRRTTDHEVLPACRTCTRSRRSAFQKNVAGYIPSPVTLRDVLDRPFVG